jgi:NAD(P)-dependent dehydrogenase (short-subunit alcohol dehydrogenase family)
MQLEGSKSMAVVLITGSSTGFGKLAALEFARRGHEVFASMRNTAKGDALASEAKAANLPVHIVALDVANRSSVDTAVAKVLKEAGRIDVLVNNAGVGIHGPIEDCDDDEIHAVLETNVLGVIRAARAVAPHMRAQGSGTIINVSSLAGKVAAPFGGVYSASKYAVEALSDSLYFELHPFGVRVVVVEPGGFETEFGSNRILARRFNEGSPYASFEQRFNASSSRLPGADQRESAQKVANVIVDAATSEAPKRRYLVGQDAEAIGALAKQMSDEDFEKAMRTVLDFWD